MNNFQITQPTEDILVAAGFFPLTPVYWRYAKEWHFEDHAGRGRDLRVTDTGVVMLKGPYEDNVKHPINYGAIRVDTEQDLLNFLQTIGWLSAPPEYCGQCGAEIEGYHHCTVFE